MDAREVMGDFYVKRRDVASDNPGFYASSPTTANIVVVLAQGQTLTQLTSSYPVTLVKKISTPNGFVVRASTNANQVVASMKKDKRILAAQLDLVGGRVKHQFVPNDPFFAYDNPTGFPGQWHIQNNTGISTIDARVEAAWNKLTGAGTWSVNQGLDVMTAVVDDGLQTAHPDITTNYSSTNSNDFGQGDADPNPVNSDDDHGTAVAGIIAARGGNSVGITGVAPQAKVAGLRVDFNTSPASHFADATTFRSSGANTDIKLKNHSYGYSSPFVDASAEVTALGTSATAGTIHVFSAGNSRGTASQDANKQAVQASPNAITVAALEDDGRFAPYSNFGANVFVTAPSSGYFNDQIGRNEGAPGITTTDRTGASGYNPAVDDFPNTDYTSQFGGTSASAPIVTGVLALAKRANNSLTTRWAKHLIVRSSDIVDSRDRSISSDGGWKTNGAGFKFNQNYGFGLINAGRLTDLALTTNGISTLETFTSGTQTVSLAIPENSTGLTRTFNVSTAGNTPLEEVTVNLNVTHPYRGDLEAFLTSPAGTKSRIMIRSGSDGGANLNWNFTLNTFWGETPNGTWTLQILDTFALDTGTLNSWRLDLRMGTIQTHDAKYVTQTVPEVMVQSTSNPVSVTFQNTGWVNWTSAANIRLGSENPSDTNVFGWTRQSLGGAENIQRNQNKVWSFNVTAPATKGLYNFRTRMLREGAFRFGEYSPNVPVRVVQTGNDAEFVSQSVPLQMKRSSTQFISITMRNTGSTTWNAGNDLYRLGSQSPTDTQRWGFRRLFAPPNANIAPGQTYTWNYSISTPPNPGFYVFQWRMVQEGVQFFGEQTPALNIEIIN